MVEFYDFFDSDPEYFFLVMELMEGGELYERITQKVRVETAPPVRRATDISLAL